MHSNCFVYRQDGVEATDEGCAEGGASVSDDDERVPSVPGPGCCAVPTRRSTRTTSAGEGTTHSEKFSAASAMMRWYSLKFLEALGPKLFLLDVEQNL